MSKIERFEDIEAWQAARELTKRIYAASNRGEFARDFGLKDQMRRAAVSIVSNIAEGFESRSDKLFADYLGRASGSAGELRAQIYVAMDVSYMDTQEANDLIKLCEKCSGQISNFMWYLQRGSENRLREEPAVYITIPDGLDDLTD